LKFKFGEIPVSGLLDIITNLWYMITDTMTHTLTNYSQKTECLRHRSNGGGCIKISPLDWILTFWCRRLWQWARTGRLWKDASTRCLHDFSWATNSRHLHANTPRTNCNTN